MLESLVSNYHPSEEVVELIGRMDIALLAGISGAGKDTIKKQILVDDRFRRIISHTTRKPRSNDGHLEQDGVDYHFISLDEAESMLKNGDFVEAKFVHGTVYGTSANELRLAHEAGLMAVGDIDFQGVEEYKKLSPEPISIFIVPPSYDEWLVRLKSRYHSEEEFLAEWPKRRDSSIKEITHALGVSYYHFVVNQDIDKAVSECRDIFLKGDTFHADDSKAREVAKQILLALQLHEC